MSLKTWILATRPWSLVMTFVSTCLAGILAYGSGSFSIPIFMLTMIGLLIAHMAANMTNDWYDVKHGVDANAPTAEYRPHPLLFGELDKNAYKKVIFSLYGVGLLISLYLTWLRGVPVLIFSAIGVVLGVLYTADPVKLKHRSVGEVSVFLAYGPLMVGGAYYVLTGVVSPDAMVASVPIALLVALVLLANNIRDRKYDASVGISTLATNKEEQQGVAYYKTLLASAYVVTAVLIFTGVFSPFSVIAFLTLREAYGIVKQFSAKVPLTSDQITAQLALRYGVLLTLGEFLNLTFRSLF